MTTVDKNTKTFRDRLKYIPITSRPKLSLPGNGRIILWVLVNIEAWSPVQPMPRVILPPPQGQPQLPDLPNWAWHEYGMRVGFWRYLDALSERNLKVTLAVNGSACTIYDEACKAALAASWEFIGHGYSQTPMHKVDDEKDAIEKTIEAIREYTGRAPAGWESPGLTETSQTLDLLAQSGIKYVANWVLDDQPFHLDTSHGQVLGLPYPVEINDVVISAVQQQPSDAIFTRGRDQFDRLYAESADSTRVMSISLHPFLTGVPHRIRYLEQLLDYILSHEGVVSMTGSEIMEWYLEQST